MNVQLHIISLLDLLRQLLEEPPSLACRFRFVFPGGLPSGTLFQFLDGKPNLVSAVPTDAHPSGLVPSMLRLRALNFARDKSGVSGERDPPDKH